MMSRISTKTALIGVVVIAIFGGIYLSHGGDHPSIRSSDAQGTQGAQKNPNHAPPRETHLSDSASVSTTTTKSLGPTNVSLDFHNSEICTQRLRDIESLERQLSACNALTAYPDALLACKRRTEGFDTKIEDERKQLNACDGLTAEEAERRFYESTVTAAKEGNTDAQLCYVASDFKLGRVWSSSEMAAYRADAAKYAEQAMRRGDWRIVQLMMTPRRDFGHMDGLLPQLAPGDDVTVYRMNRLAKLGATGDYAKILDAIAMDPQRPLSIQDAANADAWAQQTYQKYFAGQSKLSERPAACQAEHASGNNS